MEWAVEGGNGNFLPRQLRGNPSASPWITLFNSEVPLTLRVFFLIIVKMHVKNIIFSCSSVLIILIYFPRNEPKEMKH